MDFNEEETKYRIILPLLKYMAFDIMDSNKVYPEDSISERYADYTLTDYNSNNLLIEAKKPSVDLDGEPEKQIRWYCASKNINQGILTNGVKWRFYDFNFHDQHLGAIKKMKYKELDILKDDPNHILNYFIDIFWNGKKSDRNFFNNNKTTLEIIREIKEADDLNESEVKQTIIIPLLKNLGWSISRNNEFKFNPETKIKIRKDNKIIRKK